MRPRWPPRAVARLSAGESAISRDLGPPRDPEEGGRDRQQEREQEERDGGALREVARLDAREKGEAREDLGRVVGPAAREDEDHDHVGEREDEAEETGDEHDRADQRQQSQPIVPSEIGAPQGSRIRSRTSHLPRNSLSSARASTVPSTITRTCATSANTKVFRREV